MVALPLSGEKHFYKVQQVLINARSPDTAISGLVLKCQYILTDNLSIDSTLRKFGTCICMIQFLYCCYFSLNIGCLLKKKWLLTFTNGTYITEKQTTNSNLLEEKKRDNPIGFTALFIQLKHFKTARYKCTLRL